MGNKVIQEAILIEGVRKKDNSAFEYLFNNSIPIVSKLIIPRGASKDDVKDLIQESLIITYEKIVSGEFKGESNVLTFLVAICKFRWNKYSERIKSKQTTLNSYENLMNLAYEDDQEEEISNRAKYAAELLTKSTDKCKEILVAYYYDNLSMEEIALKLGYTNADNVKNQKYKCLEKLRKNI